jgi:hypothetical protein
MPNIIETIYDYNTFIGKSFYAQVKFTIAAETTVYVLGVTPPDINVFMEDRSVRCISGNQTIDVDVTLYEDATVLDGNEGTNISEFNNNRNKARTPKFMIYKNPTVADLGTDLQRGNRISAAKNKAVNLTERSPYLMKKDSQHILEITNNSINPVDVRVFWNWWENGDVV